MSDDADQLKWLIEKNRELNVEVLRLQIDVDQWKHSAERYLGALNLLREIINANNE